MTSKSCLRDRKKAATRTALSDAAVSLARAVGVDAVTADAIAAEAGVSTRTFHNYFSSKEEAILYRFETEATVWMHLLRARPADEPIWDSLERLSVDLVTDPARRLDETVAVMALVEDSPALMARKVEMRGRVTRILGEAIAERTGTDIDTDLYPNLLQMAAGAACKAAIELWLRDTSTAADPGELVSQAFRQIRAGLPQPNPATPQS
ncbi:TetR/AcrR family transcriptional regulator [Rhodococcus tukisamuensis]|uniref:DNA-binding transcriptional regulator, AcrR family n=1 Tax=Rhodococcus tukisamuensis TaxID=168276 RepID=A0A1G6PEC9_9NOCA|nr:TetR/AcrR family transcriptional regulator [Rhodococcus tukisamuensis]SDC77914.1 DNA-binding transcriptional regulator, AcrR family [Rhodococcus tukisamuensis]